MLDFIVSYLLLKKQALSKTELPFISKISDLSVTFCYFIGLVSYRLNIILVKKLISTGENQ